MKEVNAEIDCGVFLLLLGMGVLRVGHSSFRNAFVLFFFPVGPPQIDIPFFFILLVRKYLVMYLFFSWLDQTNLLPDYSLM